MDEYAEWVADKISTQEPTGIDVKDHLPMAEHLFHHQRDLVAWALKRGRSAIFADTGLGKGPMLLEWSRQIAALRGRVLVIAPLAVAQQLEREAIKFGVSATYARSPIDAAITITNYEMIQHFNPRDYAGVVLDESSILKSFTGSTRNMLIESFALTPFKLACTATPAPNDHTELGNHSEFLGVKSRVEMLAEYFVHDGGSTQSWRLKGHAEDVFWRWVCSWGAVVRKPSDLGYSDDAYDLPPLTMHEEVVRVDHTSAHERGLLFESAALSLSDQRAARRDTMAERVAKASELADCDEPVIIWCELNAEGDALEASIPGAVQVSGSDSMDQKRDKLIGFADGIYRVMVTKPSVAGFGLNWQHCARMVFVGASHSYEQTYQAIRRCWRFGQTRQVDVFVIRAETEDAIVANFKRKEIEAEQLYEGMVVHMRDIQRSEILSAHREWNPYQPTQEMIVPAWIGAEPEVYI